MAKSRASIRILRKAGILVSAAAVIGGGLALYRYAYRNSIPELEILDVNDQSRQAATVTRYQGVSYFRQATPEDEKLPLKEPKTEPGHVPLGFEPIVSGGSVRLGTLIRAEAKSRVEFTTNGQWYMGLDGEGGLVFTDARRNARNDQHVLSVYVQKGTFRAKAAADNYKGYFLDISTAAAKIHVLEGEIGMSVNDEGRGRMWLMNGRAEVVWNDGKRKELGLRGLEDL